MSRLETRFEDADESAGLLLWQVTNRWQAAQRAVLKPFGLTHVQFVLLASLAWLSDDEAAAPPVSQRVLADHAATDPMMTSQVVRALEAKGWLVRERHPGDGRAFALRITDGGLAIVFDDLNVRAEFSEHRPHDPFRLIEHRTEKMLRLNLLILIALGEFNARLDCFLSSKCEFV